MTQHHSGLPRQERSCMASESIFLHKRHQYKSPSSRSDQFLGLKIKKSHNAIYVYLSVYIYMCVCVCEWVYSYKKTRMWIVQDRSWGISRLRPRIDDPSWATSWRPINTLDPGETTPKSTQRTNLVGGFNPSEKSEFVSWDYSSQHMEKWNMFQTTTPETSFCWLLHISTYSNHPNLYPFVVKKKKGNSHRLSNYTSFSMAYPI